MGKSKIYRSKSFVLNFINQLYTSMGGTTYPTVTSYSGNSFTLGAGSLGQAGHPGMMCYWYYVSGNTVYEMTGEYGGIVVGTGTNAVAPTDVALQTRIAHGTGAGQLEYLSSDGKLATIDTGTDTGSFILTRLFRNSSGNTITINEVGVTNRCWASSGSNSYMVLMIRDIVSPGQDIADTEYLKVTYTLSVTS